MSGPYDVPDEPDDVTLWAGRLRAWPTPPTGATDAADDEIDDDTAVSPRQVAADTVRVERPVLSDETVRGERPVLSDQTVRVERPVLSDQTVRVERPSPRAAPAHRPSTPPDGEPADETISVERRRPRPSVDVPVPDDTTAPARARGVGTLDESPADAPDETPTSDTAAGTRRARSRVSVSTAAPPSGDPVPTPREARLPVADHELYRPRADEAVRVARTAAPARSSDAPDAAEVLPRSSRRARKRGLVLAVTVVVLVAAAAIGLFLLMG